MKLLNCFFLACIFLFSLSTLKPNSLKKLENSLLLLKSNLAALNNGLSDVGSISKAKTLKDLGINVEDFKKAAFVNLDLSNKNLKNLPSDISNYNKIKFLNLSNNLITKIDSNIGELYRLSRLNLNGNNIQSVPASFSKLRYLGYLFLSNNKLNDNLLLKISKNILKLENLMHLDLSHNNVTIIPEQILQIKKLCILILNDNKIVSFSLDNHKLNKLKLLNLKNNKLSTLPNNLGDLSLLTHIVLSNNEFQIFPKALCNSKIRFIDLDNNAITSIPNEFLNTDWVGLKLSIANNKLTDDAIAKLRVFNTRPKVEVIGLPDDPAMVEKKAFISWLESLDHVDTGGKNITLDDLPEIWQLNLSGNDLTILHSGIKYAVNLRELYLSRNNITTLPAGIKDLKKLEKIIMFNNPNQDSEQIKAITGFNSDVLGIYTKK